MATVCVDVNAGLEWAVVIFSTLLNLAWTAFQEYRHRKEKKSCIACQEGLSGQPSSKPCAPLSQQ